MRKHISLAELNSLIFLLNMLKHIGLLEQKDFMVTWEQRPKMILNQLGNFEFENPQEVYGCKIEFWDPNSFGPGVVFKFIVGE